MQPPPSHAETREDSQGHATGSLEHREEQMCSLIPQEMLVLPLATSRWLVEQTI